MRVTRLLPTVLLIATVAALGACRTSTLSRSAAAPAPVVLVCEHGSVKSLMAASLFNQAAVERGLPFRAVSRGVTPDESVPPKIAAALSGEGFDVKDFRPTRVSNADISQASRIVAIGVDLSPFTAGEPVPIEQWNDVPAASVDYAAAHRALKQHVDMLINELQSQTH
jgi:hypothetical protein